MLKSVTLKNGTIKHTMDEWIGYQAAGDGMAKTKWTNLNAPKITTSWVFEASIKSKKAGYEKWIVNLVGGKLICDCGGYYWTRNCKHVKQVRKNN